MHTLSVTRTYTPLVDRDDQWEKSAVIVLVWKYTRGSDAPELYAANVPPDEYVKGLLSTYIDNRPCPLHEFDEELSKIGYTRQEVLQGIRSAE